MENLKKLEKSKLLKELDYIKTEFSWRKEVISSNDPLFINSVNEFLNKNPEIKKEFDEKINSKIDDLLEKEKQKIIEDEIKREESMENEFNEELNSQEDIDQEDKNKIKKIKSIYRQIVKITHPDKVNNKKLNNLYLEATDYYQQEDIISLYLVCDDLDIPYEIEESEFKLISNNISKFKDQVKFFENTFTWNWYNTEDKDRVVVDYIKRQLI
jgi:DNA mismatch repair ATPase MutS